MAILILLLVAQIITVAVLFSDDNRLSGLLTGAMSELLHKYDNSDDEGKMAKAVWNILMTVSISSS